MTNVIFVGDSFSDDTKQTDILNLDYLRNLTYLYMGLPGTVKPSTFFGLDVVNQKKNNIIIHTLGRGSYGNHVISETLFNKVNEIRQTSDEKIYAVVQLSALVRNGFDIKKNIREIDTDKYPYDYIADKDILDFQDLKNIFDKHLDNIENIDEFCKKNNVDKIIFFGWSAIYDDDIPTFNLNKRISKIKDIVTFFPHEKTYDEMESYCFGKKVVGNASLTSSKKIYTVNRNSFGGMTEYIRERIEMGERYYMQHDAHLSTKANLLFYNDIIKEWFINQNIIDNINLNDNTQKLIDTVIKWEKLRYDILTNSSHNNSGYIRGVCFNMLKSHNIDLIECESKFKELNKELEKKII